MGYHFVVRLDGTIEAGRPLGSPGAHCLGKNNCSIGVCYVGGVSADGKTPADTRTPQQKEAMLTLIAELKKLFPDAKVCGHRDFANKACPSFDATREFAKLFPVWVLSILTITALPGCKSVKSHNVELTGVQTVQSYEETRRDVSKWLNDSLEITLLLPEIEVYSPDSQHLKVKANKIMLKRKKSTSQKGQSDTSRRESTADSFAYTGRRQIQIKAAPSRWLYTLPLVILLLPFLLKIIRKLKKRKQL